MDRISEIWQYVDWALLEAINWDLMQTAAFVFFFEVVLLGILLSFRERRREEPQRSKRLSPFEAWTDARRESNAVLSAHKRVSFTTPKSVARFVPRQRPKKRFFATGTKAKDLVGSAGATDPWSSEASWGDLDLKRAKKSGHRLALPSTAPPAPRRGARANTRLSSN
jgi:hypothetical protein